MTIREFTAARYAPALALLLVAALTAALYYPALSGPLVHDDIAHLGAGTPIHWTSLDDPNVAISLARDAARWVTMGTFGLQYLYLGDSTAVGKTINLGIHLLNGGLLFLMVYWLLRLLPDTGDSQRGWLALAVAAIWLLHPLQVSTVAYTIQRLTLLSATFSLAALALWARWTTGEQRRRDLWQPVLALALTYPAFHAKENGALVPLFLLLTSLAAGWRPRLPTATAARVALGASAVAVAALVATRLPGFWAHTVLPSYELREFDLTQRVLTEARVLVYYLSEILWPAQGRMSLYLDDFSPSQSLISPPTTLLSLLALGVLAAVGALLAWRRSLVGFGILFFLAGHAMESTVIGLELAYEHRNYLPLAGIAIAFVALVARLPRAGWQGGALALVLAVCALNTAPRAVVWSSDLTLHRTAVQSHPDSPRANFHYGMAVLQLAERSRPRDDELAAIAREYLLTAASLEPSGISALHNLTRLTPPGAEYDALWNDMYARARYGVISRDLFNTLQFMTRCAVERPDCPLAADRVERLFRATRENPRLAGDHRRNQVERLFGTLLVRSLGKADEGLAVSRAVATADCPLCRVSYFRNLVAAGRIADARAYYPAVAAGGPLPIEHAASLARALRQLEALERAAR